MHRLRNLRSKAPDSLWAEIAARARGCYMAASPALAVVLRDDFVAAYERELPAVVHRPVIRAADRWRGIQVGEFEQWQLRALRDALNRAHAQRVAPAVSRPTSPVVRKLRK